MSLTTYGHYKTQHGSVLMWGLVILLVMTILGVVGARMASTDVKIAGNEIFRVLAYQAAESTLERSSDLFFQNKAAESSTGAAVIGPFTDNAQGGGVTSEAKVSMSYKIPCETLDNLAMSVSMNSDEYQCRLFDVEVEALVPGTSAKSSHALGMVRLVPSSPSQ